MRDVDPRQPIAHDNLGTWLSGGIWRATMEHARVLYPHRALLHVEAVSRREVAPRQKLVVSALQVGISDILGRRQHFDAGIFLGSVHQRKLDAQYRGGIKSDVGNLAGQRCVPVSMLVIAARIRVVGMEAFDVEIVSVPIELEKLKYHGILIYLRVSERRHPRNVQCVTIGVLLAAKAGPQVTPFSVGDDVFPRPDMFKHWLKRRPDTIHRFN